MGNTVEKKKFQMAFFSCIYKIHIQAVQKLGVLVEGLLRVCKLWSSHGCPPASVRTVTSEDRQACKF